MKILLIEDDAETAGYIARGFEELANTVDIAAAGDLGLELAQGGKYDVLIVDRMVPGLPGLQVVERLRRADIDVPILILTARAALDDRVEGLEVGADDYLVKPFAFSELHARVRALHRRGANSGIDTGDTVQVDDLMVDFRRRRVTRADKRLDLTPQEYKLLEFLARRKGETVTRTMLLENLWGYDFDPRTNIVDAHISRLRGKIDRKAQKPLLRTLRGVGYVLDDPA